MKILIGCEYSGTVREAFRKRGHDAYSCDLLAADDESPHHYMCDVSDMIRNEEWDMIIFFPPCTALAVSGNAHYGEGKPKHNQRIEAAKWTRELWDLSCERSSQVAMENPVGVLPKLADMKPTQYVEPWMFGEEFSKKTALFLHGLPKLKPSNIVGRGETTEYKSGYRMQSWINLPPSKDRWKIRSKTFQGLADAMAQQWG